MPRELEERAARLREQLNRLYERSDALMAEIKRLQDEAAGKQGMERWNILRRAYKLRDEWNSVAKQIMNMGVRLARIEEALGR